MYKLPRWVMSLALLTVLFGCGVDRYSASTTAKYQITPDGKFIEYVSNKEQQGLLLDLQEKDGKVVAVKISVDSATTSERAIAAAQETNQRLIGIIEKLAPLLEKAAMAGS
jgi:hypothetical protein